MTSNELFELVKQHRILGALSQDISPNEVFSAANIAQKEILRECELLVDRRSPTLKANIERYSSQTPGWSFLARTIRPLYGIRTTGERGVIEVRPHIYVEQLRARAGQRGQMTTVPLYFYILLTDPLTLGVWGIPTEDTVIDFYYVRNQQPNETISATNNPLIPSGYEMLLTVGTVYYILFFRQDYEDADNAYTKAVIAMKPVFEAMKSEARMTRTGHAHIYTPFEGVNF